jgi:hypothetical protein
MNMKSLLTALIVSTTFVAAVLVGCGTGAGVIDDPALGVTPGGQEDIAAARARIEQGYRPDPDTITVEGFLSEHDIELPTPPGAPEIFASFAAA